MMMFARMSGCAVGCNSASILDKTLPCHQKPGTFVFQTLFVVNERYHLLGFLSNVQTLVTVLLDMLKIPQCLNAVDVFSTLLRYLLTSAFDQVVKEDQAFVDVSPVLAVIVQSAKVNNQI